MTEPWNTDKYYGDKAEQAKAVIHKEFNSPATFCTTRKQWQPKMSSNQGDALREYARRHPRPPLHATHHRTIASLESRGWIKGLHLTDLGLSVIETFFSEWTTKELQSITPR